MKIKYTYALWDEAKTLTDGSEVLIKYKQQKSNNKTIELLQGGSNYLCSERYYLDVNLPKPRELQAVLIVKRSSQNCYRVIYTDNYRADMQTLTGLNTVNKYIEGQELHIKTSTEAQKGLSEAQRGGDERIHD
jgi:hypothetical protein